VFNIKKVLHHEERLRRGKISSSVQIRTISRLSSANSVLMAQQQVNISGSFQSVIGKFGTRSCSFLSSSPRCHNWSLCLFS